MTTLASAIFDALPLAAGVHDDSRWLASNEAMRCLLGADHESIDGRPISDFVHPDGRKAGEERRRLLLEHRQRFHDVPVKMQRLDGVPISATGSALVFMYGDRPVATVAACTSGSCSGWASGLTVPPPAYAEDVPLLDAALDCFMVPVLAVRGTKVAYANRAGAALMHARDTSQIIGLPVLDLFHPATLKSVTQQIALVMGAGASIDIPAKVRTFDGDTVNARAACFRMSHDGEHYGVAVATHLGC